MNPTVLISPALDDVPMSPDAFRVYFHLARLVNAYGEIYPSYREIGTHCFPELKEESARTKAIRTVKELLNFNVIRVEKIQSDRESYSNQYFLTEESEWHRGGAV